MEGNEGIEIPSKVKAKAEPGLYINYNQLIHKLNKSPLSLVATWLTGCFGILPEIARQ